MQKIVFFITLALLAINTQAQIKPDVDRSKVKRTPAVPATAPAPPPAPVNKTTDPANTPVAVYSLTSVRVKIKTGNDNKEFPSRVIVGLGTRNTPQGQANPFTQFTLTNEMRINTETEFGLDRDSQLRGETKLDAIQSSGLRFFINYTPNLIFDAWKIESISVVLEFRDQFGNLHPTLGSKTIVFSNAYGFLNNEYHILECTIDGYFSPLTAVIKK